ncbi:site-specific integrase [Actinocrispum wychmicini]|nr:site-specific integrase [Actinocrispum wychmicini]
MTSGFATSETPYPQVSPPSCADRESVCIPCEPLRRDHRAACDRPVQERPRARHPYVRRAVQRRRRDHPPSHPRRPGYPVAVAVRPARTPGQPRDAVPVQRKIGTNQEVISPATVVNMLRRRCEELAERHPSFHTACFTPHDFRTYVSHLIEAGYDELFVQQQVGHEHASTTSIYTHVSPDYRAPTVRAALDRVAAQIKGKNS